MTGGRATWGLHPHPLAVAAVSCAQHLVAQLEHLRQLPECTAPATPPVLCGVTRWRAQAAPGLRQPQPHCSHLQPLARGWHAIVAQRRGLHRSSRLTGVTGDAPLSVSKPLSCMLHAWSHARLPGRGTHIFWLRHETYMPQRHIMQLFCTRAMHNKRSYQLTASMHSTPCKFMR